MAAGSLGVKLLEAPDDIEAAYEWFYEQEMTDGLPVIPPTAERVERMVRASGHDPEEVISVVPPRGGQATVAAIAANGVMAGCKPEYMPVLLAAAKALGDDDLNVRGVQATTGGPAMLVLLNGPIRNALGVNCGTNAWGQGFRANATIGRAVRLMITTLGGVYPGKADKGTQGNPGKYSLCVGENEEASPWEPFHVEHGYDRNDSTVTLMAGTLSHSLPYHKNNKAIDILTMLAVTIPVRMQSTHIVVGLCPERATDIARGGYSKQDIKEFLHEQARRTVREHKKLGNWSAEWNAFYPRLVDLDDDDARIPSTRSPDDYAVLVTGGAGGTSVYFEMLGSIHRGPPGADIASHAVTVRVETQGQTRQGLGRAGQHGRPSEGID